MKDFGYDVADYTDVDPRFGTLDDFDELLAGAHDRGLRVIIDLVLNHTSDEHPWFSEARASRHAERHDWYLWSATRPNNWKSAFELKSAWWPNPQTDEYYLGTFTRHQPEVNWRNPQLRRAMYDVMRFWLDRGVDGFRLDVVNWFLKDELLRSNPPSLRPVPDLFQHHLYDRNRPETIEICREMRSLTDSYEDRVMVGEVYTDDVPLAASYHGDHGDALHMAFNFNFLFQPWSAKRFADAANEWYRALPPGAWPNFTLSNHDQHRHISRYAKRGHTDARARVAAALLLTLKGTPFIYYGEEIGMRDTPVPRGRLQDPLGRRSWPLPVGRDPERTPMQWNAGPNAGFTEGTPWLPINRNSAHLNVERQSDDPDSLLSFYRALLDLRKTRPRLHSGDIEFLVPGDLDCFAYRRLDPGSQPRPVSAGNAPRDSAPAGASGGGSADVIALNFADRRRSIPARWPRGTVLFGTHRARGEGVGGDERITLAPNEVVIYDSSE
jgi:alpha-glucosidase